MLHNFAITNSILEKLIIPDMHHRIAYMYINFQQNRVSIDQSKTVHTKLFAKNNSIIVDQSKPYTQISLQI